MFQRCLFKWEVIHLLWHQFTQLREYLSNLGCRSKDDWWSDWALLGVCKAYFVKGDEDTNIDNISKRRESYQICVLQSSLLVLLLLCPGHTHTCRNLSRLCCCQRCLPPFILSLYIPFLYFINSLLRFSVEEGYMDHPGFLSGYQVMYNQKKSPPLCRSHWLEHFLCHTIKHPSSCNHLGFTVELFHAHSVWTKLTKRKRPSTEPVTDV